MSERLMPYLSAGTGGKDEVVKYADYTKLQKPLPSPPPGFRWERDISSGEWVLIPPDEEECGSAGAETTIEGEVVSPDFIEHVIMPEDTLVGICLRYKASKAVLRRHNDFFGEQFRLCRTLRIPVNDKNIVDLRPQAMTKEVKMQITMNRTGLADVEAKIYLDDHNWDVATAVRHAKEDLDWEAEQGFTASKPSPPKKGVPASIATEVAIGVPVEMRSIRAVPLGKAALATGV
eukprot:CAMPEP_0185752112 /NCGR_PEP_ID=MMETSP1174-20130828/10909_1 /TAXON_ID=35687 /ORGANISM="Dictyocha speculum, Strain CCMP1381" /LENGTH=232 /DNA_ID=CAMNT_0028429407 /DNA_START=34 /DNA_END=733 /DNA_ORIENTATION=+